MRSSLAHAPRAHQRGWVGLIVVLVALVIVAVLAKDALKQYGLLPGKTPATTRAGTPGERARAAGAVGVEALDPGGAAPAAGAALDRARDVGGMMQRQADERAARGDGVTR